MKESNKNKIESTSVVWNWDKIREIRIEKPKNHEWQRSMLMY